MSKNPAERAVRDIRRKTRKQYSAEEKIRIVVSGLRGEDSIAELCRREGIAESLYYSWPKEFLEAGKKRLSGDTARQACPPSAPMRQKSGTRESSSERLVKNIRRVTRKQYSSEEKIRIVLDGLRGEFSIAELCRREGIAESLYYSWSKEFLEAGKRRLAGDTARAATSSEATDLRREARQLKEVVAEQAPELRLLKKSMIADGGDEE